jgi:hypothetical protein
MGQRPSPKVNWGRIREHDVPFMSRETAHFDKYEDVGMIECAIVDKQRD